MEKWKRFLEGLDFPSGAILGVFTTIVIGLCVWATVERFEIPASVVTIYQFTVGAFAGSKTVKTFWGRKVEDPKV